jgi:hypothetical protein
MIRLLRTEGPWFPRFTAAAAALCLVAMTGTATGATGISHGKPKLAPRIIQPTAFDVSPALRDLAPLTPMSKIPNEELIEIRTERGEPPKDRGYSRDGALQRHAGFSAHGMAIPGTSLTFEGLSNQDNFNIFGGRVNPPDNMGAVGPNHYVEQINLVYAVYDKQGNRLVGPFDAGSLWAGFAIPDCTDPSGDPVVLYDKLEDRWLLSQFTTRGLDDPSLPFYNCVAISVTGDPTGAYYRYAFKTQPDPEAPPGGTFFPDYPKYGNWKKSYVLTTRDFGLVTGYGISVYALEKNRMIAGDPNARAVQFFLDSNVVPLNLIGDGLLPADFDGTKLPKEDAAIPVVGTQDDGAGYGATIDALNIWNLKIKWQANPIASITLAAQLPTAAFDSIFPCAPTSRDCLPEPGIVNPAQFLDILSYRQRPTWRLAYRNFNTYESLVTNQSVEAAPGVAGVRWYEIRRSSTGAYSIYQQGTYAPGDGVHRWMGSIAQDKNGNMALGYSVVNGTTVFPGIRYTGRLAGDPLGQMSLGEGTIVDGTGVQRTTNSRWGDYTSMNVDPTDDCTFWYVNEYYTLAGQLSSTAGWQTRVGSFKLPGCQ